MSARARRVWIALGVVAIVAAGFGYFVRKRVSELPVYTTAGARIVVGEEIYSRADLKPFTYPPFFALPFVPLAMLPESLHRPVWYAVNVLALWWILRRLRGALRPFLSRPPPREAVFWILVAVLAARHVTAVFENQSHDLLVMLFVVLAVTTPPRRDPLAGALIGTGAACKATPLLFLPALLVQRRWRAAVALALVAAGCTLLPDLLFPRADSRLWAVAWMSTFLGGLEPGRPAAAEGAWHAWNLLNQNLAGMLYRLGTPVAAGEHTFDVSLWNPAPGTLQAVTIAAQLAVLGAVLAGVRRRPAGGADGPELALRRLGEGGAVLCGMVLLSPMSSKSHFCVLLVPVAFCVAELLYRRRSVVVALLLGFVFVTGTLTTRELVGRDLGRELLARGSVTWSAFALLVATCVLLLRAPPQHASHVR